jgi:YfiH family protein
MPEQAISRDKVYQPLACLSDRNLVCAFSSRAFKNMSLCYGETKDSLNNRKNFLQNLGIDYRDLVCAKQIHSARVKYVKEEDKGRGSLSYESSIADTDALITDKKNLPLAVFTADCLSVFLYDPLTPAIGLVHAGWQGTRENIISRTVQLMQQRFNTKPVSLCMGFGPVIRSCCYEVGKDFKDYFCDGLIERNGRFYLDLAEINKKQALDSGVLKQSIFDSGICTSCCAAEFFSYRKEGASCSRMVSVIMLKRQSP